jgi:hypothetical protein
VTGDTRPYNVVCFEWITTRYVLFVISISISGLLKTYYIFAQAYVFKNVVTRFKCRIIYSLISKKNLFESHENVKSFDMETESQHASGLAVYYYT